MRFSVLIAGVGQLGSRYLQGLSLVQKSLDIWLYDVSERSLDEAERRWAEVNRTQHHRLYRCKSVGDIPEKIDLTFVTTTADCRLSVVRSIEKSVKSTGWILEKVLAQSLDQINQIEKLLSTNKMVWVNTPMHVWSLYRNIRDLYSLKIPISASFVGFQGLACNAIHYIDFVSRWNGAELIEIDTSLLKPSWYPAKRAGFYEVDGEIRAQFSDGSKLKISSESKSSKYEASLTVGADQWIIYEQEGVARDASGRTVLGPVELQSEMTAPFVEAFRSGNSGSFGLPTLMESVSQHKPLINALLKHWNANMPQKLNSLPIT